MTPINANTNEYLPLVGLKNLYIAEVTQDDASAYVADTPEYFADAVEAAIETTESNDTYYLNDKPSLVLHSEGPTTVTMKVAGIPMAMIAKITGKVFDAVSGRLFDVDRVPPYCALAFKSLKTDGKYQFIQYLKGIFSIPKVPRITKGEKMTPQWSELIFTAIHTKYEFDTGSVNETSKGVAGDEDTTNFSGTTWFDQVQTPVTVAPDPLALSSSNPVDGATGVVVSSNLTLTFNNVMQSDVVDRVVLMNAATHAVIASAITLDATKKIVTINPDASLAGATEFYISYAVEDIYSDTLSGVINFTTA